jgi:ribonucleoside-triphosphate reductase
MAGKYGYPYFANFLNSDMKPEDARSMCCRLRLDLTELQKRNGGLFGSGDSTGSIGVVTINLPRIGYETKGDKNAFFAELDRVLDIAKDSLEIKREWLQKNVIGTRLIPAFDTYVGTMRNHFSTIGVVGMNCLCENFFGEGIDILTDEGKTFCLEVGNHIRNKLLEYQKETGNLYNFEASPAESTAFRLAKKDKELYPDIITRGTAKAPYYTNSCHIPVNKIKGIKETFEHQEALQILFTGGTVIHIFCDGAISGETAKNIIDTVCHEYKVPYVSISPLNRYCPEHGYIADKVDKCPVCGTPLKLYQRITGYLRCIDNYNDGKKAEFDDRVQLKPED